MQDPLKRSLAFSLAALLWPLSWLLTKLWFPWAVAKRCLRSSRGMAELLCRQRAHYRKRNSRLKSIRWRCKCKERQDEHIGSVRRCHHCMCPRSYGQVIKIPIEQLKNLLLFLWYLQRKFAFLHSNRNIHVHYCTWWSLQREGRLLRKRSLSAHTLRSDPIQSKKDWWTKNSFAHRMFSPTAMTPLPEYSSCCKQAGRRCCWWNFTGLFSLIKAMSLLWLLLL